jgi:hypothetical protein
MRPQVIRETFIHGGWERFQTFIIRIQRINTAQASACSLAE